MPTPPPSPPETPVIVERVIHIAAPPPIVFAFLTEPARLAQWLGRPLAAEARPGGALHLDLDGVHIARGQYLTVVPHERVVVSWGWEQPGAPFPPGATTVEFTLTADGAGTLLRLRHRGLTAQQADGQASGWDHYLPRLARLAQGETTSRAPSA